MMNSEGALREVPTDRIMKRFDDVDQKMQTVLDTIKTISGVLEDLQRGTKDTESMNAIIERVTDAVMAFHAHREEDHPCFGETNVEQRHAYDVSRGVSHRARLHENIRVGACIEERARKKFKRDSRMLRVASQESCSGRT